MDLFLDTSAAVPLLLQEVHSDVSLKIWNQRQSAWAWSWMAVETDAALIRRKAGDGVWRQWRKMERCIEWIHPVENMASSLRIFNRSLGLRAADAGHLYVFDLALRAVPDLQLFTFDRGMRDAALRLQYPVV